MVNRISYAKMEEIAKQVEVERPDLLELPLAFLVECVSRYNIMLIRERNATDTIDEDSAMLSGLSAEYDAGTRLYD